MANDASALREAASLIGAATIPEDLFGKDPETAHHSYRAFAWLTHPDPWTQSGDPELLDLATKSFQLLSRLWSAAEQCIKDGTYGNERAAPQTAAVAIVQTKAGNVYRVSTKPFAITDVANLHVGTTTAAPDRPLIIKVAHRPGDRDLLQNEAKLLKLLWQAEPAIYRLYVPKLMESFGYRGSDHTVRQANVLEIDQAGGWFPLTAVHRQHPVLNPKDIAWILRRLLTVLGFVHQQGYAYAQLAPDRILIHPRDHGLLLVDWTGAVEVGKKARVLPAQYRAWYEHEPKWAVYKQAMSEDLDIIMAARCMAWLMGAGADGNLDSSIPMQVRAFLRGCQSGVGGGLPHAWQLLKDFTELIERLWGDLAFRPFPVMREER